jgi:hypothetical protein
MLRASLSCSGGLVPDLECHDYPHGRATDDCIQLAMKVMSRNGDERRKLLQPVPDGRRIPYAMVEDRLSGQYG